MFTVYVLQINSPDNEVKDQWKKENITRELERQMKIEMHKRKQERVDTVCHCSAAGEDLAMKKHGLLYNDR